MAKKYYTSLIEFFNSLIYCFKISWHSCKLYTVIRMFSQITSSLISICMAYIGKDIINILVKKESIPYAQKKLLMFLVLLSFIFTIISKIFNKIREYSSNMQQEKLTSYINTELINKSVSADLSFFDSPKYYNEFESVKRDISSVTSITWNIMDGIGYTFTFISTFVLVGKLNIFYSLILTLSVIPSSIVGQRYAKKLYHWSKNRIAEER